MRKLACASIALFSSISFGGDKLFGFYHVFPDDIESVKDWTNVVHIQAANPDEPIEQILKNHPTAKFIFEFNALDISLNFQNGCQYEKCHFYDRDKVQSILTAVENTIEPYKDRIAALMIADEPETNSQTMDSLNNLITDIKQREKLTHIPLWINFDNINPVFTNTSFQIPNNVDWVSLTPNYGQYCYFMLCEQGRYDILFNEIHNHPNTKIMVVGDGWSNEPDAYYGSRLYQVGIDHLTKIDRLYDGVKDRAIQEGVDVVGMMVFSWSFPGPYTVKYSTKVIKETWKRKSQEIIDGIDVVPIAELKPPVIYIVP